ncbi:TBC1 domain family member 16-like [Lingula anatina]|uniref:TBC1 domain family member 16-like n=1 Tax=Lingula anatina TaxID=7574 RepID=A0A1S3IME5_LINAN|nr:TBC1 domain family member 16-like [Lingula anatina]XP_013399259.1 TBC1 domain family member 16-like [Lingula anatina]XP_013399260.1 TBC1 domain family member 16-like [Lingula anatina]|eukprot:XP_013399258.1 TBC1 domain family member 16-like [Lingula anatina]
MNLDQFLPGSPSLPSPTMAFSSLFRKASSLLGLTSPDSLHPPPLDGEIIYCKNNVCVHPPASIGADKKPIPGYLSIRCQGDEHLGSTLILTWIPNSTLKKNPRSIQNSPSRPGASPRISPRRAKKQEFTASALSSPSSEEASGSQERKSSSYGDRNHGEKGCHDHKANDNISLCSDISTGEQSRDAQKPKLSTSLKSQADSGIGSDDIISHVQGSKQTQSSASKFSEGAEEDVSFSSESASDSLSAGAKLKALINKDVPSKPKPSQASSSDSHENVKERTSSTVSIEMDGDKLVVVTEEVEDNVIIESSSTSHDLEKAETGQNTDVDTQSLSSDSTNPSPSGEHYQSMINEIASKNLEPPNESALETVEESTAEENGQKEEEMDRKAKMKSDMVLDLQTVESEYQPPDINITTIPRSSSSSSSTTTSGPDSRPPTPYDSDIDSSHSTPSADMKYPPVMEGNPESFAVSYNLTFPENSVTYTKADSTKSPVAAKSIRDQMCGVFSVDLGQMRSLRLFYNEDTCTSGQFVIASRESQYKILHFHHGGLDKLAEVLEDWNLFREKKDKGKKDVYGQIKQFSVMRPELDTEECHPEEGVYGVLNEDTWKQHMAEAGQIVDDYQLRKVIFFGGLDPALRHEAWPFLLQFYPFDSTFDEREHIRNDKYIEYQGIRKKRESMTPAEQEQFWRGVQCTVEKDVVRTDRSNPYFMGEDNPNIDVLKSILLNYAVQHPKMGYTQGMSDLLAPVLAEVQHEADAYWCFEGLMQKTIFVSSPKDVDMDKQLEYLRELLRLMQPKFYHHLRTVQDGMELLFCHRWILLCFKREFPEADALRIWEACWAHYQTDYFHLFICVAIIAVYGADVVEQKLPADEMLLHFSSLAMHMRGNVILRKARGLLHQFRALPKIPCTLHGLCSLCGPGMWDSGHVPTVECTGNHGDNICPHNT